jgi:hypothetical protein
MLRRVTVMMVEKVMLGCKVMVVSEGVNGIAAVTAMLEGEIMSENMTIAVSEGVTGVVVGAGRVAGLIQHSYMTLSRFMMYLIIMDRHMIMHLHPTIPPQSMYSLHQRMCSRLQSMHPHPRRMQHQVQRLHQGGNIGISVLLPTDTIHM